MDGPPLYAVVRPQANCNGKDRLSSKTGDIILGWQILKQDKKTTKTEEAKTATSYCGNNAWTGGPKITRIFLDLKKPCYSNLALNEIIELYTTPRKFPPGALIWQKMETALVEIVYVRDPLY